MENETIEEEQKVNIEISVRPKAKRKNKEGEVIKDLKYWICRGAGIAGGIIALITFSLPWYQITGPSFFFVTPIYMNINGVFFFFWDYYYISFFEKGLFPMLIMMDLSIILIIISALLCFFTISRKPSSMIMVVLVLSFLTFGLSAYMIDFPPFSYTTYPFFGASGPAVWGLSIGWPLLIVSMILTFFPRLVLKTENEKFFEEWKKRVSEIED